MGLAFGVATGLAAGLLAAPLRGSQTRATLRSRATDASQRLQGLASTGLAWAQQALGLGVMMFEEGREAFNTSRNVSRASGTAPGPLTASLGDIASMHSGTEHRKWEVTS